VVPWHRGTMREPSSVRTTVPSSARTTVPSSARTTEPLIVPCRETCNKTRPRHGRRQTQGMKFPSTYALSQPTGTLCSRVTVGEKNPVPLPWTMRGAAPWKRPFLAGVFSSLVTPLRSLRSSLRRSWKGPKTFVGNVYTKLDLQSSAMTTRRSEIHCFWPKPATDGPRNF